MFFILWASIQILVLLIPILTKVGERRASSGAAQPWFTGSYSLTLLLKISPSMEIARPVYLHSNNVATSLLLNQTQVAPAQFSTRYVENLLMRKGQVELTAVVQVGIGKPFAKVCRQSH